VKAEFAALAEVPNILSIAYHAVSYESGGTKKRTMVEYCAVKVGTVSILE
jgi:hypothetical protein